MIKILKFTSPTCRPCKVIMPVLEKISEKYGIKLVEIDRDSNKELVEKYNVRGLPTTILKDGAFVYSFEGYYNTIRKEIEDKIEEHCGKKSI